MATHKSSSEENLLAPPFDILAKGLVEKADAFRFIVVGFADKVRFVLFCFTSNKTINNLDRPGRL